MALRIVFMMMGLGFWFYFQDEYRADMKGNMALIGAIISFTAAAYFKDIDKYLDKKK
ncbi:MULTISPECIES: hypothetical protein [Bacillus amyloliquefaciens group]|uniref:hypothetical protein n=1 Tax=Bacillus amyloliquefaciens group TaxID=1938374 RepID=UPI0002059A51|nr:hypothetical protein [Bacillus amyloliquefaciens]AEB24460.1 hypothetical protein BAMTA208_11475 [Bacillus amyloliquefaciens TA208]AEK89479.1 hypothetical protein BAXH7_02349 [Bacillus amyloliquefaciens XH7]MEC1831859.1 hypothetical protein [Bacillus amyloliquefaciens]MEC1835645.1 hypothetical protein [Bacillus amyloliquefaciens]MEC1844363.1 hypothetical protein [Bacillus amyloliquefaciens]